MKYTKLKNNMKIIIHKIIDGTRLLVTGNEFGQHFATYLLVSHSPISSLYKDAKKPPFPQTTQTILNLIWLIILILLSSSLLY